MKIEAGKKQLEGWEVSQVTTAEHCAHTAEEESWNLMILQACCCCRFQKFFFVLDTFFFVYDFTHDFSSLSFFRLIIPGWNQVWEQIMKSKIQMRIMKIKWRSLCLHCKCSAFSFVILMDISFQFPSNIAQWLNLLWTAATSCTLIAILLQSRFQSHERYNRQGKKL